MKNIHKSHLLQARRGREGGDGEAAETGKSVSVGMDKEVDEGEAAEGEAAWQRSGRKDDGSKSILGIKNRI